MLSRLPNRQNPQPLAEPSRDSITTPGRISLSKAETIIREKGWVSITGCDAPGIRKTVRSLQGGNEIDCENIAAQSIWLNDPGDFVFLESTGLGGWVVLYSKGEVKR